MPEFETTTETGSGLPAGTKVAVLRGTFEGEAGCVAAPAPACTVTGSEDARTIAPVADDNPLFVRLSDGSAALATLPVSLASVPSHAVTNAGTFAVQVSSIAAGDNNIGNVDIVTLPALAAGTNNIGDVDVLSVVPGTGATALGKAIDSAAGATDTGVAILAIRDDALSALTPVEGDYAPLRVSSTGALHVTGAAGTTQYAEDTVAASGDSLCVAGAVRRDTPGAGGAADGDYVALSTDSGGALYVTGSAGTAIQVDDAAFTPASGRVAMVGFTADEGSTDAVDEGDGGAARMTLDRKVIVTPYPHTAGGLDTFKSLDLDETEEQVKATAGQLYGWWIFNAATSIRYVKFYNDTAANVTVGTTTPLFTLPIPAAASGGVAANALGSHGITFSAAITVAATTGLADNDTGAPGANEVVVMLFYK
jgi:hypothetical protein